MEEKGRDYINPNLRHEIRYGKGFIDFIKETLVRKQKRNSPSYLRGYNTLIKHLEIFSNKYNTVLYVESINENFLDDFFIYLEENDCRATYMGHILVLIKSMLVRASKFAYAVDPSYLDYEVQVDEPFSIALSEKQIARVYYFKGLTRCQERIRDLFIIGSCTAMRYSDYSTLTDDNLQGNFIRKVTKKTNKEIVIPCHQYVTAIHKKYKGFPQATTTQNFNRQIKIICKKIGLDDVYTFTYHKGGKLVTDKKCAWELVGSHTARRSALTILYLSGRLNMRQLMAISGHTTEKSLHRYLKCTIEETATELLGDTFFKC